MTEPSDDLWTQVNEAEADAEAAEARALAAEARARAIRLRRRAAEGAVPDAAEFPAEHDIVDRGVVASPDVLVSDLDSPGGDELPVEPKRRMRLPRLTWRRGVAATAVITSVGMASLSGYWAWCHDRVIQQRDRASQFSAAAADGVLRLTTLDFAKAQDNVNRVLEVATGPFKNDFQSRSQDFVKVVEQSKVVSKGTVQSTAVESMNDDSAVVMVAATSEIIGPPDSNQKPRAWRLLVTVSREGDKLKLSKVDFVQ